MRMIDKAWLLAAVIALWTPAAAAPEIAGRTRPLGSQTPRWLASCRIEDVEGESLCGRLEVPEDRRRKTGRRITLNIVVLKATGADRAADPLFIFVGGPGQAATADASDDARRFKTIRHSRDIVLIDQRGTGRSNPLACQLGAPATVVNALVAGDLPTDLVATCRRALETAADLRLYTTSIAADDVEDVRQRLGYGRINLYGGSYGSRAALVFLQRYPTSVRTATLRSVFPPDLRNPLYSSRDAQRAFELLMVDCAADAGCRASYPDLAKTFESVLDRLERQPARLALSDQAGTQEIAVTPAIFAGLVRRMLYTARGQAAVPAVIYRAAAGDFSMLRPAVVQTLAIKDQFSIGMFLSVTCTEDVRFIRRSDLGHVPGEGRFGTSAVRSLYEACHVWPKGATPPARSASPAAPTLLLSGAADPVTPPAYASKVAKLLRNTRSVVMAGEAHGPFPDCGIAMMTDLVISGGLPRSDPPCVANTKRTPFLLTPKPESKRGP